MHSLGWREIQVAQGEVRAVVVSALFQFRDDVAVRTEVAERSTLLHARSASRIGKGDLAANASHLLLWMALLYLGFTMIDLPHKAWGAELSTDYDERSRITSWREALSTAGQVGLLAFVLVLGVRGVDGSEDQLRAIAWLIVLVLPVLMAIAVTRVPEGRPEGFAHERRSFFGGLRLVARNPAFGRMIGCVLLFVLAGVTFGLGTALAGSALAVLANLLLSHLLARRLFWNPLSRLFDRFHYQSPDVVAGNAFGVLLLLRLTSGLPSALKNYASALADVPFMVYLGVSWATTLLYAVGLIVLGDSLNNASLIEAGFTAALLGAVFAGTFWYLKQQRKDVKGLESDFGTGNTGEAVR